MRTPDSPHPVLIGMFAAASGLAVANIYYAQPLIAPIAHDLGLHAALAGLIVAMTQLGYGAGLLFVVPLSDVCENRKLVVIALSAVVVGLLGVALSDSLWTFLIASFVVGVGAVATQVLIPFASHLAPSESRGRVVGTVMAGVLGGIMLARPLSSFIASELGWRAVFFISAGVMFALILVLLRALPARAPPIRIAYLAILRSLPGLFIDTPVLRRRAPYMLAPEMRGRLNGVFMTFVFMFGALGSVLAAALYWSGGWNALAGVGALLGLAALACYTTEFRQSHARLLPSTCGVAKDDTP